MIWADALCINQGDQDKRSQQVSILHSVYSSALRTLVGLGTGHAASTTEALKLICEVVIAQDETHLAEFLVFDLEIETTQWHRPTEPCSEDISELISVPTLPYRRHGAAPQHVILIHIWAIRTESKNPGQGTRPCNRL